MTGYNCEKCKNRGFSQRIRYDEYYKRWELVTVVCDCVELRKKIALEERPLRSGVKWPPREEHPPPSLDFKQAVCFFYCEL